MSKGEQTSGLGTFALYAVMAVCVGGLLGAFHTEQSAETVVASGYVGGTAPSNLCRETYGYPCVTVHPRRAAAPEPSVTYAYLRDRAALMDADKRRNAAIAAEAEHADHNLGERLLDSIVGGW